MKLGVIDYGAGNLRSVLNTFEAAGVTGHLVRTPEDAAGVTHLVLPGVGAFGDARRKLDDTGLVPVLLEEAEKKPLLGICLGMQLLFDRGFEYGEHPGLGLVPGQVVDLHQDLTDQTLILPGLDLLPGGGLDLRLVIPFHWNHPSL